MCLPKSSAPTRVLASSRSCSSAHRKKSVRCTELWLRSARHRSDRSKSCVRPLAAPRKPSAQTPEAATKPLSARPAGGKGLASTAKPRHCLSSRSSMVARETRRPSWPAERERARGGAAAAEEAAEAAAGAAAAAGGGAAAAAAAGAASAAAGAAAAAPARRERARPARKPRRPHSQWSAQRHSPQRGQGRLTAAGPGCPVRMDKRQGSPVTWTHLRVMARRSGRSRDNAQFEPFGGDAFHLNAGYSSCLKNRSGNRLG